MDKEQWSVEIDEILLRYLDVVGRSDPDAAANVIGPDGNPSVQAAATAEGNASPWGELGHVYRDVLQGVLHLTRQLEQAHERLTQRNRELGEVNHHLQRNLLEMARLAMSDPLTGLLNRRAIEAVAQREVRRRARKTGPLALGLIDADHFKEINRRHLWPGGDQALMGLARALIGSLRAGDSVGRIGGEEFLLIAPETDLAGGHSLGERIRSLIEQTPINYKGQAIGVTVSIGFAVADTGVGAQYEELKHVAAEALAEAKTNGRNRCVVRPIRPIPEPTGEPS
jgi:diguanylate cyclase (GGDEF)-like protein